MNTSHMNALLFRLWRRFHWRRKPGDTLSTLNSRLPLRTRRSSGSRLPIGSIRASRPTRTWTPHRPRKPPHPGASCGASKPRSPHGPNKARQSWLACFSRDPIETVRPGHAVCARQPGPARLTSQRLRQPQPHRSCNPRTPLRPRRTTRPGHAIDAVAPIFAGQAIEARQPRLAGGSWRLRRHSTTNKRLLRQQVPANRSARSGALSHVAVRKVPSPASRACQAVQAAPVVVSGEALRSAPATSPLMWRYQRQMLLSKYSLTPPPLPPHTGPGRPGGPRLPAGPL
jgi:hypothetical protein